MVCINLIIEKKEKSKENLDYISLMGHMKNLVDKVITKEVAREVRHEIFLVC